jgi:hypothetical protein
MASTEPIRSPDPNSPFDPFDPFDPWTRRPMPKRPFETTDFSEAVS